MTRIYKKPYKPPYLVNLARELRRNETSGEKLLWNKLKNRCFSGLKFRRQVPYGRFIFDFYCKEKNLAIEIDGTSHQFKAKYNQYRDQIIDAGGIKILHFSNVKIVENIDSILINIQQNI